MFSLRRRSQEPANPAAAPAPAPVEQKRPSTTTPPPNNTPANSQQSPVDLTTASSNNYNDNNETNGSYSYNPDNSRQSFSDLQHAASTAPPPPQQQQQQQQPEQQPEHAAPFSPSLRGSVKPTGFALPPIGIDAYMEDPEFAESNRITSKDITSNPEILADKVNRLSELVQELSIKNRDNNAILCQMLFLLEERMNRKIDIMRDEMNQIIEKKFQILAEQQLQHQLQLQQQQQQALPFSTRSSIAARRGSSFASLERNNSAASAVSVGSSLSAVFENVDSSNNNGDNQSVVSTRSTSLAIPKPPSATVYENKEITPYPGFVIKTRKLIGEKEKVFINVFHHELIEIVPGNLPRTATNVDAKPYLVMGSISRSLDANGRNCSTFNVGVSSEYFKANSEIDLKITSPDAIQKVNFFSPTHPSLLSLPPPLFLLFLPCPSRLPHYRLFTR